MDEQSLKNALFGGDGVTRETFVPKSKYLLDTHLIPEFDELSEESKQIINAMEVSFSLMLIQMQVVANVKDPTALSTLIPIYFQGDDLPAVLDALGKKESRLMLSAVTQILTRSGATAYMNEQMQEKE